MRRQHGQRGGQPTLIVDTILSRSPAASSSVESTCRLLPRSASTSEPSHRTLAAQVPRRVRARASPCLLGAREVRQSRQKPAPCTRPHPSPMSNLAARSRRRHDRTLAEIRRLFREATSLLAPGRQPRACIGMRTRRTEAHRQEWANPRSGTLPPVHRIVHAALCSTSWRAWCLWAMKCYLNIRRFSKHPQRHIRDGTRHLFIRQVFGTGNRGRS